MEILLDENTASAKETLALGVQTGDIIAMDPRTIVTESGYIKSRFLDDKLFCCDPDRTCQSNPGGSWS